MKTRKQFKGEVDALLIARLYKDALRVACHGIDVYPDATCLYLGRMAAYNALSQPRSALEDSEVINKLGLQGLTNEEKSLYYAQSATSNVMICSESYITPFNVNLGFDTDERKYVNLAEKLYNLSDQYKTVFSDSWHINLYWQGYLFLVNEKWGHALKIFDKLIKYNPTHKILYYYRAMCHDQLDQKSQCFADCITGLLSDGHNFSYGEDDLKNNLLALFEKMLNFASLNASDTLEKMDLSNIRRGQLFRAIQLLPKEKQLYFLDKAANSETQLGQRYHSEYNFVRFFKEKTFVDKMIEYRAALQRK